VKRHFVLDENIIRLAEALRNERDDFDDTCLKLILAIQQNCHALVMEQSFLDRYFAHVRAEQRQRGQFVARVTAILVPLLQNTTTKDTKWVQQEQLTVIEGLDRLPGVDVGDREFVRAAATVSGSILATTDGPLRDALESHGIIERYDFSALTPGDALVQAGPEDP